MSIKKEWCTLTETIKRKYWDNRRQLFADTKEKNYFSQHTNTLAILTGIIKVRAGKTISPKNDYGYLVNTGDYLFPILCKPGIA